MFQYGKCWYQIDTNSDVNQLVIYWLPYQICDFFSMSFILNQKGKNLSLNFKQTLPTQI